MEQQGEDGLAAKRRVRRVVGAVGLLAGAVAAVVGSTLPQYRQVYDFGADQVTTFRMTLWGTDLVSGGVVNDDSTPILYGVPVVVAAVLLVVAACLVLAAPRLPDRVITATSVGAMGAAALLLGSVWTVGQLVLASVANHGEGTLVITATVESGVWTLVLACVLAVAGGLLAQDWPGVEPSPEPEPVGAIVHRLPDEDDTDTPPLGFPVPGGADS
ncbi:hypothetical protein [Umezawaea sp. NPDC059074]|uniref:hypothetical protein n=1 Tax=Umezawaea sp. NPDC059074 TaxID=3346716 RepID=UPI00369D7755